MDEEPIRFYNGTGAENGSSGQGKGQSKRKTLYSTEYGCGSGRAAGSGTGEWQMQSQGKTGSGASEREETGLYKSVQRTWDDSSCDKAAGGSGCSAGDTG